MIKETFHTSGASIGPYSPACKAGNTVYISGLLGIRKDGTLSDNIEEQTHCVFANLKEVLDVIGVTFSDIVKMTIFLIDMEDFQKVNAIYASYFEEPHPARSCVAVAALPKGASIELEAIVVTD